MNQQSRTTSDALQQGILWWMLENQDVYRQDTIRRMIRMTHAQRTSPPREGLHSPQWLLVHLAELERHYLDILQNTRSDISLLTIPSEQPEPNEWPPWQELLEFMTSTRREFEEHLRQMNASDFDRTYGRQPYLTGGWIIAHLFEHESFHMGQLRWALTLACD